MTIKRFSRVLGMAAGLAVITLSPSLAVAQEPSAAATLQNSSRAGAERASGSRATNDRSDRRRQRAPAPVDPAVIKAEVEALLTAGSTACQVTEANLLGVSAEQVKIYETACAGAPGYIVVASNPPQIVDCIVLDNQAKAALAANPETPPASPTCAMPANQDIQGFLKAYAVQAGVPCTVDEAKLRGQATDGGIVYEIGCAGVDGYWIEKNASGWEKTECLQVANQNGTCQFTTPAEQAATVKAWLTGSEAAACDVQQVRLMGQNANGRFIELTCAGAEGVIIRMDAQKAVQQVYPCATAQQIGGGCKLTTTAPAAAPQA